MGKSPKQIVRDGYDLASHTYRSDAGAVAAPYDDWLRELTAHLPVDAAFLDLGCGCGVPVARELARRYRVTGVDLSPVQVARARQLVPAARFLCADMGEVDFAPAGFDAVVCLYAIIHLPLQEQPGLFARLARWLRPGGLLVATVGHRAWTGTEDDWLGVKGATMYWSHADAATYRRWMAGAGFELQQERFVPEGEGGHTFMLAERSAA